MYKENLYQNLNKSKLGNIDKTKKFIYEAKQIHGDRYDYSNSIYRGVRQEIEIICPIHGSFYQTPQDHINQKCKCPYCRMKRYNKKLFLKDAHRVHSKKYFYYDLQLIKFRKSTDILKIKCPHHGIFYQRIDLHLRGYNCPKCSNRSYNYKNQVTYQTQELSILSTKKTNKTQKTYNTTCGDSIIINYKPINQ